MENTEGLVHFEQAPYSATPPQKLGGLGSVDSSSVTFWGEAPAAHIFLFLWHDETHFIT